MEVRKGGQLDWPGKGRVIVAAIFGILGVLAIADAIFLWVQPQWVGNFLVTIGLPGFTASDMRGLLSGFNVLAAIVWLLAGIFIYRERVLGVRLGYVMLVLTSLVIGVGEFAFRIMTIFSLHLGFNLGESYFGMNIIAAALAGHLMMKDPEVREVLAEIEGSASKATERD